MEKTIKVRVDGSEIYTPPGLTLSEIISGERPCGGGGRCGKCKVIAKGDLSLLTDAERKLLSPREIASGVRLACLTVANGECDIFTTAPLGGEQILTESGMPQIPLAPTFSNFGVAVDIGTTTIAARLYDTCGNILSTVTAINPELQWGADVVSRIEAALAGKAEEISRSVRGVISKMIEDLASVASVNAQLIERAVITGNTVMLSLLVGESVEPFSHAPFAAKRLFGERITAGELGIYTMDPGAVIYLPPAISAFVGADTVCAILATELLSGDTAMLADVGTNGEMALWHGDSLFVASTAAGPAFEGVGISMGMRGSYGAIDKVTPYLGGAAVHVIGDTEPRGICGSGLVDAAAYLLESGELDESGYLEDSPVMIKSPVSVTQKDIRMLQLAKSAICAGLMTLLERAGISKDRSSVLYVAGGFGTYLNKNNAARIGLLPRALAQRAKAVGNAALAGASMLLLSGDLAASADMIAQKAEVVDLATSPIFSEHYMSGMLLDEV